MEDTRMRKTEFRIPRAGVILAVALLLAAASVPGAPVVRAEQTTYKLAQTYAPKVDLEGAYLGVRLTEETEHSEGGARVTHVVDDSPAHEAGLREDDIIVEFDGEIIRGPMALTQRIHAHEPGERVALKLLRDGRPVEVEVELGQRSDISIFVPDADRQSDRWQVWQDDFQERMEDLGERLGRTYSYSYTLPEDGGSFAVPFAVDWGKPKLGVQLIETTPELREHLGGSKDEGVLVSKVLPGTPAARAEMAVGDLIVSVGGKSVATVDELREALHDKEGETFTVEVVRDHRRVSIEVTIPAPNDDRPSGPRAALIPPPARPAPVAPLAAPAARPALPAPAAPAAPAALRARPAPVPAPLAAPAGLRARPAPVPAPLAAPVPRAAPPAPAPPARPLPSHAAGSI
jgi:hypothetical protein